MKATNRPRRIVLDTDVVVAAMRSGVGASAEIVRLVRAGEFVWIASLPLFFEYREVCSRPIHAHAASFRRIDPIAFVSDIAALVTAAEIDFKWRGILSDPDDEKTLEAALNGAADIVTFNVRDYAVAAKRFALEVVTPAQLLRRYRNV